MKLQPSLKQKKRYIVFEILVKVNPLDVKKAVNKALLKYLGEFGVAKIAPMIVKQKNNKFILKVNHKYIDEAKSAIILIKTIKNKPVIVRSIITSGTIKKATTYL